MSGEDTIHGYSSVGNVAKTTITNSVKSSGVQANRNAGNLFRDELAEGLRQEGRNINTEVFKRTPFGNRFVDIEVSQNGNVLGGIEAKFGKFARYRSSQRIKDAYLKSFGNWDGSAANLFNRNSASVPYPISLIRGR